MKTMIALLTVLLAWDQTAFGCPSWWEMYKPQLTFFGINSSWVGSADKKMLSIRETLQGWREVTGLDESDDLKALVYDTTLEEIASLRASILDGSTCELAKKNTAAAALAKQKRLDVLDYLLFLRESEKRQAAPAP